MRKIIVFLVLSLIVSQFSFLETAKAESIVLYPSAARSNTFVYDIPQRNKENLDVTISTTAEFYYYSVNGVETAVSSGTFNIPASKLTSGADKLKLRITAKSKGAQADLTSITAQITQNYVLDLDPPVINVSWSSTPTKSLTVNSSVSDTAGTVVAHKYAAGDQPLSYFATGGTSVSSSKFTVTSNGFYTVYARDNSGNETRTLIEITNIDSNPPSLTVTDTLNTEPDNVAEINVSASDENGIASKKWALGIKDAAYFVTGGNEITGDLASVTGNGDYTFYARDSAGNTAVQTITITRLSSDAEPVPQTSHAIELKKSIYTVREGVVARWLNPDETLGSTSKYTYSMVFGYGNYPSGVIIEERNTSIKSMTFYDAGSSAGPHYWIEKTVFKDGIEIDKSVSDFFAILYDYDYFQIDNAPVSILIPFNNISLDASGNKTVNISAPMNFVSQLTRNFYPKLCLPSASSCITSNNSSEYIFDIYYQNEYVPFQVNAASVDNSFYTPTSNKMSATMHLAETTTTRVSPDATTYYHVYDPNFNVTASGDTHTANWGATDLPDVTGYRVENLAGTTICNVTSPPCVIPSKYSSSELKLFVVKNGEKIEVDHFIPEVTDILTTFGNIDFGSVNHRPGTPSVVSPTSTGSMLEFTQSASTKSKYQITMKLTPFLAPSGNSIDAANFSISDAEKVSPAGTTPGQNFSFANDITTTLLDVSGTDADPGGTNRLVIDASDIHLTIPPDFVPNGDEAFSSTITYSVVLLP